MSHIKCWGALLGVLLLAACGSDKQTEYSAEQEQAIAERIAPAGALAMEGDPIASAPVVAAVSSGPRSGEDIYQKSCFACHATGAAGAPKLGDAGAWAARIGQGLDTLVDHAWNGFKTMPAKGNCFDCSEEEIKAAVQYIVDGSQ
ncbi:cytochrome c5 family protein [bacterium SCSIO 12696]|nr:cytochrome c5 family protein [bacterium SCSIO 12696]